MAASTRPPELERWPGRWDAGSAAHLLRRAGFGGDLEAVERLAAVGLDAAVDGLLSFDDEDDRTLREVLAPTLEAADIEALCGWWLYRMRFGRSPLREKLALFWHGNFATSNDKVQSVPAMAAQLGLFLDHAAGPFGELLHGIARDPAMLLWLDAAGSDVQRPNENLARELFELFSLGIGAYTESDIREAARALTGRNVERGRYRFDPARHDSAEKHVLGRRGPLDGDDVVDAALEQPACARHLARRLLEFFVTPEAPSEVVDSLAQGLRENDLRVSWALDVLFRSRLFHEPRTRRILVKSPVELVVGLLQALGATGNFKALGDAAARMGQSLLRPPSVRGWVGGLAWVDAATMLERHSFPARLLAGRYGTPPEAHRAVRSARAAAELLLAGDVSAEVLRKLDESAQGLGADTLVQAVAVLPEVQLS